MQDKEQSRQTSILFYLVFLEFGTHNQNESKERKKTMIFENNFLPYNTKQ